MQIYLTDELTTVLNLPIIELKDLKTVRGNLKEKNDIIVDTISALAIFITESAKHGKDIAEIAKDGIKGIKEWAQILQKVPALVPVIIAFYNNVVKNAEEFYTQVQSITPEQKEKSKAVFIQYFDIANDKAEEAIEKSVGLVLEILMLLKVFK